MVNAQVRWCSRLKETGDIHRYTYTTRYTRYVSDDSQAKHTPRLHPYWGRLAIFQTFIPLFEKVKKDCYDFGVPISAMIFLSWIFPLCCYSLHVI